LIPSSGAQGVANKGVDPFNSGDPFKPFV
jgi:hypothetical protein